MANEFQLAQIMVTQFGQWGITNYSTGYDHLAKTGATIRTNPGAKDADATLHSRCHPFAGRRKSRQEVMQIGRQAYQNGGGVCTTSAFAVAFKLHERGITDRIEIIGQGSLDAGHMWVVVGRDGGTVTTGGIASRRRRPENTPDKWGNWFALDAWVQAFGWNPGAWKTPKDAKHHFFIRNDINELEITYDSDVEDGD